MKRVVCLYRVSSKGQVDKNDIPMQRIACREYIKEHATDGWQLEDEKYEKGVSGFKVSAKNRDAIVEIRTMAEAKQFDILLVFMSDRLGRKDDETPFLVEWFIRNGIEVWSVKDGQLKIESHTDKLINYIRFWQASGESLKTSERVSTRQEQMTEAGIWRGGGHPYGYKLVMNGRIGKKNRQLLDLEIDPDESVIVREIYDLLCNSGMGTYRIANYLNSKYPCSNKIWSPKTILSILRNRMYVGRLHFNNIESSEPLEHLRIITDEQYEFAQRVLQEHIPVKYVMRDDGTLVNNKDNGGEEQDSKGTKTSLYGASMLSGILYCAHCGHKLVGTYHTKINARGERVYRPVYRCYNGAVQARNCDGKRTYSAARIEDAVIGTVRQYFSTFSKTIDELWKEQAKAQIQRKQGFNIKQAEMELAKLQNRQNKLKEEAIKALTGESVYDPKIVQELLSSNAEAIRIAEETIREAKSEKLQIDTKLQEMSRQYNSIRDWAEVFDIASVDEKKMILARIIKKITVNRDYEITIHFLLTLDDFKRAFDDEHAEGVSICESNLVEKTA